MVAVIPELTFCAQVEKASGQKLSTCYQCGKCSASCPAISLMAGGPRWLIRAVQLGLRAEVVQHPTIWHCLFCATCSARCPAGIDIHQVMEALRLMAVAQGIKPAQPDVARFHRLFLQDAGQWGRVFEMQLGGSYNLYSGHLLDNLAPALKLLAKGRLPVLPEVKGNRRLKALIARTLKREKGNRGE